MKTLFKFNWINGLGLSFIFTGFLYFLKIAADAGWLPPELRSALGAAIGCGTIFLGIHFFNKSKTVLGESIAGLGTAIIYATLAFVSFSDELHFSPNSLLIAMLSIGVLSAYFSVKFNMRILAILSTVGGLITPLIIKAADTQDFMLFIYLLIINCVAIYVSTIKNWQELKAASFLLTLALFGTYYVLFDPIHWSKPLLYSSSFFVVYLVGLTISVFKSSSKGLGMDSYLSIVNSIAFVFWSTMILNDFDIPHLLPLIAVSVLYVLIGLVFYFFQEKKFNLINGSYLLIGAIVLSIASSNSGLILQHGLSYVLNGFTWLGILIAAYFVGKKLNTELLVLCSYLGMVSLTIYWYTVAWEVEWIAVFGIKYIPFLNAGALVWIGLACAGFYFSQSEEKLVEKGDGSLLYNRKPVASILGVVSHLIVGGLLTVQIQNLWDAYALSFFSEELATSIVWMIYATLLFLWSTKSKEKIYTIMGTIVLILTSLKVFIFDLSGSATYQKVIFLMIVGGITLLIGHLYNKSFKTKAEQEN